MSVAIQGLYKQLKLTFQQCVSGTIIAGEIGSVDLRQLWQSFARPAGPPLMIGWSLAHEHRAFGGLPGLDRGNGEFALLEIPVRSGELRQLLTLGHRTGLSRLLSKHHRLVAVKEDPVLGVPFHCP